MSKFKTYAFTLRPQDGIDDEHIKKMEKFVRKNCEYYHLISEKTGYARHLHAALYLKKESSRSHLSVQFSRLFSDLSPTERTVMLKGLKVLYNNDWVTNYLDKDDDTVVIASNLPEKNHLEAWYPVKQDIDANKKKKCSHYYWELEELWYKYQPVDAEVNTMVVRDFLFRMMYAERVLPVMRDDKTIVQTARHLVRWLNKTSYSSIELAPFEKEE